MYGYKLNNSYTIYVNYTYLNECRKASKKSRESSASVSYNRKQTAKKEITRVIIPIALETKVHHKTFGDGKVVESDRRGYISVVFSDKIRKFQYPQAFDMGFLAKVAI